MMKEVSRSYANDNFDDVFIDKLFSSPYQTSPQPEPIPSQDIFKKYHLSKSNFTVDLGNDEIKKLDICEFLYNWHDKKINNFKTGIYQLS